MSYFLEFVYSDIALCRAAWVLLILTLHCVVLRGFFGTGIALCRIAWALFVMEVRCVVLLGFCWY